MTKKEYLLQYIVIGISLLAVFASIFAGIMAYNASITSAEIGGKLNKDNELETRIYQQRYDLYKSIGESLTKFNINNDNLGPIEKAKLLKKELKGIGYQIRIIGTPYIICRYSNLLAGVDYYISDISSLSKKKSTEEGSQEHIKYWTDVIPQIFLLERSIRNNILQSESVELELAQSHETQGETDLSYYGQGCSPGTLNVITEDQYF